MDIGVNEFLSAMSEMTAEQKRELVDEARKLSAAAKEKRLHPECRGLPASPQ